MLSNHAIEVPIAGRTAEPRRPSWKVRRSHSVGTLRLPSSSSYSKREYRAMT